MEQKIVMELTEQEKVILERVELAGVKMTPEQIRKYLTTPDDLGQYVTGMEIPPGYKKCGGCQHVMKFYLFNKNSGSKTNTTGNCKVCQKKSAQKSYDKTKQKRDYKKYYRKNRERKQAHARRHYEKNKDTILARQKQYHTSDRGKAVMQRAHAKRRALMAANQGIPCTRDMVIERDKRDSQFPICYYCKKPITDLSGDRCHIDHVIPVVINGADCFTNKACMHDKCNLVKKKDATDITPAMIAEIRVLSEQYIDAHPEQFGLDKE